jgi:membrane-associated phospholipid phosphatase
MGLLRLVFFVTFVCSSVWTTSARADEATWELKPAVDVPVIAVELVVAFGWLLGPQLAPAHCAPRCDRKDVWIVDRFAAGRDDRVWARVGDAGIAVTFAGALVALVADEGWGAGLSDFVVWSEAVIGAMAAANLTSLAVRRPRPYVYGDEASEERRLNGTASLSFFSGHSATAFAGALALFQTVRARHPNGAGQWIALGAGLSVATTVAVSRVLAGEHFPTDALAGSVVGAAIGWLVPELHRRELSLSVGATSAGGSFSLMGVF